MVKRIAVIGAGPTGLSVALFFVKKGFKVELIDPWNEPIKVQVSDVSGKANISRIAKKSKHGSDAMYQYPISLISKDKDLNFPLSETIGGLSSVWGANVWFPEGEEIGLGPCQAEKMRNAKKFLLSYLPILSNPHLRDSFGLNSIYSVPQTKRTISSSSLFRKSGNYLGSSILAVDKEKCINCGACISGCPTDAIFSSEFMWRELIRDGKVLLHEGFAQSISSDNSIQVNSGSDRFRVGEFDKIFVACGAIATTGLLQRSGLIPTEVYLADTQVFYIPMISTGKYQSDAKDFTLARLYFRSKDINSGLHISIYESSPELVERAKSFLGFINKIIPTFFWNQILAGIGFMPPELSGRLRISYRDGTSDLTEVPNKTTNSSLQKMLKQIRLDMVKARLFPIVSSAQIPNVGASYHVGTLQSESGDSLLSRDGQIAGVPDMYIVDSSSLPRIPIGPITVAAMVNAIRIAEISFDDL